MKPHFIFASFERGPGKHFKPSVTEVRTCRASFLHDEALLLFLSPRTWLPTSQGSRWSPFHSASSPSPSLFSTKPGHLQNSSQASLGLVASCSLPSSPQVRVFIIYILASACTCGMQICSKKQLKAVAVLLPSLPPGTTKMV